jgi:hypothetical protein
MDKKTFQSEYSEKASYIVLGSSERLKGALTEATDGGWESVIVSDNDFTKEGYAGKTAPSDRLSFVNLDLANMSHYVRRFGPDTFAPDEYDETEYALRLSDFIRHEHLHQFYTTPSGVKGGHVDETILHKGATGKFRRDYNFDQWRTLINYYGLAPDGISGGHE